MLSDADVGRRVVVRRVLGPDERGPGGEGLTDVIGVLEKAEAEALHVRPAAGAVIRIPLRSVVAGKVVPARPVTRRDVRRVELAATHGWPGLEQARLGDWLLRAGGGFTGRANSCLAIGEPGRPLADAVAEVERWYAERGLPPTFALPEPLTRDLDALLHRQGWAAWNHALVMTGRLGDMLSAATGTSAPAGTGLAAEVEVLPAPDPAWLSLYHYRGQATLPQGAVAVLAAVDGEAGFARVVTEGRVTAIGRGAVTQGPDGNRWLGMTAIEVDPGSRRRGLGRAVVVALARWGIERGAEEVYLQMAVENDAARALYEGLGLSEHHRYHYRRRPARSDI